MEKNKHLKKNHSGNAAKLTAVSFTKCSDSPSLFRNFQLIVHLCLPQMRNQDLNLDKQQYEILACHKNLLLTDCLPSKNIMK